MGLISNSPGITADRGETRGTAIMNPKPANLDFLLASQYQGPEQPSVEDLIRVYRCWALDAKSVRAMLRNRGVSLRIEDLEVGDTENIT